MKVKQIESMRWRSSPKTYSMSKKKMSKYLDNLIKHYSDKLDISFNEFKSIFEKKNESFYFIFFELYGKNKKNDEEILILHSLSIPDTTDYVEKAYTQFIELNDEEKMEFLKRIEPIKSKLEI